MRKQFVIPECLPAGRQVFNRGSILRLVLLWIPACAGMTVMLSGCASEFNPATHRQETLIYDDEKEKAIGASVALDVEKNYKIIYDVDVNARVEKILKKITDVCDRQDLVYTIAVIDEDEVNAFSLPGGYVYINKGLIDKIDNDDQLASVIGHEVAHITAKHAIKRLQAAYGATILGVGAIASGNGALAVGINLTASSILFANSRDDEFEADRLGVEYMRKAGYDPRQMKLMLGKLQEYQQKQPARPVNYWRTHPFIPQRMARADAQAKGASEFKDYLNITGEER